MPDEILIVAAEASADLHAARALEELRKIRPGIRAFGVGGPCLRAAGLETLYPAEDLNVMGIAEVLPKIPRILAVLRGMREAAARRRPAVALLVDSPDFNLRLAKHLKRQGVKVVYYISPMIWAWRRGRARQIAKVVDRMLCILPFEERFYEGTGVSARFVGHPFAERTLPGDPASYRVALGLPAGRITIALLPGSRSREIERIFPAMLEAAERIQERHPDVQFVVPVAITLREEALRPALARHATLDVRLVAGRADEVVGASDAALVKSGTSTLETALMQRPMVVVYKMAWLSYWVAQAPRPDVPLRAREHPRRAHRRPRAPPAGGQPGAHGRRDRAAPLRPGRPAGAARRAGRGAPVAGRAGCGTPRRRGDCRSPSMTETRSPVRPRALVCLPTYDEKENVVPITEAILAATPDVDVLIIDDNSPDGTGKLADGIAAREPRVKVLHRAGKEGLGKAYLAGFDWALRHGYELILEMDADFSHDPRYLPGMLEAARGADLVLGSRNVPGGGTVNWGVGRKIISRGGSLYARTILGIAVRDLTGGFKCFHRKVLESIDLPTVECSGYAFQIELTFRALRRGFRVVEVPIVFVDRRVGQSKMSKRIVLEALRKVWSIRRSNFR